MILPVLLYSGVFLLFNEIWSGIGCFVNEAFIFSKFSVHVWSRCGGLNKELSLLAH